MASFSTSLPGWEDVTPIPQNDGPNPVCAIAYAPPFRAMMDVFRAVIASNERSERVLQLTEDILEINAANYTVWQYRRETLFELGSDLNDELDYMDTFAEENPKNYQIWYHRRAIVERLGNPSRELAFTAKVFEVDGKNYHAWSHRQWVISTYGLWDGELEFTEAQLDADIRNNSAWNQRWFVVHSPAAVAVHPVTEDMVEREVSFTMNAIERVRNNESAWNYLNGIWRQYNSTMPVVMTLSVQDRLEAMLAKFDGEDIVCPLLWETLASIREQDGKADSLLVAKDLYRRLSEKDTIRSKYWAKKVSECDV
mmetsp:Transcript_5126/g.7843  ORF Transcript_5126/g.7843 Transcript_5126/m.7843 type:complete len:311 (-) Transcript_5126:125-1057(-)|eukprot:CAMPEP_0185026906 /NCGR_PEP_ID=MMETSP1103-20130426/11521_1 /TAXON_ID=36769 /ORGANISM="Paraphysomonas bandaiensis, Strain Caron Lab Isolate" /LENGTH=310 /DNA_ID=CAMNT_0027560663 /DNA_START=3 /DNA_END=935 /DNA_ORIENTATION=+